MVNSFVVTVVLSHMDFTKTLYLRRTFTLALSDFRKFPLEAVLGKSTFLEEDLLFFTPCFLKQGPRPVLFKSYIQSLRAVLLT